MGSVRSIRITSTAYCHLMAARRAAAPELLLVGSGQSLYKSPDDAFRLEVLAGILFKGLQATLGTEIVISAIMLGHQIRFARVHRHPADRILYGVMCLRFHQMPSLSLAAETPEDFFALL
jgi:hypothetical protein